MGRMSLSACLSTCMSQLQNYLTGFNEISGKILPFNIGNLGPLSLLSNGYRGLVPPGEKQPGREAGHSPLYSAEVKNTWRYTSAPLRLHGVAVS